MSAGSSAIENVRSRLVSIVELASTTEASATEPPPENPPRLLGFHPGAFCDEHWAFGLTAKGTLIRPDESQCQRQVRRC